MELLMIDERDDWARGKAEKSKKIPFPLSLFCFAFLGVSPWKAILERAEKLDKKPHQSLQRQFSGKINKEMHENSTIMLFVFDSFLSVVKHAAR